MTEEETTWQNPPYVRAERTAVLDSLDVAVDDLPATPVVPRDALRDLARLAGSMLSHLHGVEAQVTSLGRELTSPQGVSSARAVALISSTLGAVRTAISSFRLQADRISDRSAQASASPHPDR